MVLAEFKERGARRNHRYCKERYVWTIVTPKGWGIQNGDSNFSDLKKTPKKSMRNA